MQLPARVARGDHTGAIIEILNFTNRKFQINRGYSLAPDQILVHMKIARYLIEQEVYPDLFKYYEIDRKPIFWFKDYKSYVGFKKKKL